MLMKSAEARSAALRAGILCCRCPSPGLYDIHSAQTTAAHASPEHVAFSNTSSLTMIRLLVLFICIMLYLVLYLLLLVCCINMIVQA